MRVAGITPVPGGEEAAAIVAALELLWPQPVEAEDLPASSDWRLSGRHWAELDGWPRRDY